MILDFYGLIPNTFITIFNYNPFNGGAIDSEFGSGEHIISNTNFDGNNIDTNNNDDANANNYGSGGHFSSHPRSIIAILGLDIQDKTANLSRSSFEIELMNECEFLKSEEEKDNTATLNKSFSKLNPEPLNVDTKYREKETPPISRQEYVSFKVQ